MKKVYKLMSIIAFILTISMGNINVFASPNMKVNVNGKDIIFKGQQPKVINNVTYIPLRGVLEELGFKIDWNPVDSTIILKLNDEVITIYKDSTYKINSISKELKNKLIIVNNSTMVPFREIGELIGAQVNWDSKNKTISIITKVKVGLESSRFSNEDTKNNPEVDGMGFLTSYFNIMEARIQKVCNLGKKFNIDQHYSELTEEQIPRYFEEYTQLNNQDIDLVNQIVAPNELEKVKKDTIVLLQNYTEVMKNLLEGGDYTDFKFQDDSEILNYIIEYCKANGIDHTQFIIDKFDVGLIWTY